ncbi:MAG: DUF2238 domain-containing protein [Zetaproteobacteria bacterium]|nr:MAG: DUF2238 domain-containing protein [Zetaproteobacteria bacterium]
MRVCFKILRDHYPFWLAAGFLVFFLLMGVDPVSRKVWWAETIPVIIVFVGLVISYPWFRFSNAAYSLMAVWLFLHTIGGHYTFAGVPFDMFSHAFGFERNHFDRIGHFSVGFYAFAIIEWLLRRHLCGPVLASLFGILAIMAVAAAYEMIEWWYAVVEGGEAGLAFLGSQGDIWDAQKDMLADTLGAITAVGLFWGMRPHLRGLPRHIG